MVLVFSFFSCFFCTLNTFIKSCLPHYLLHAWLKLGYTDVKFMWCCFAGKHYLFTHMTTIFWLPNEICWHTHCQAGPHPPPPLPPDMIIAYIVILAFFFLSFFQHLENGQNSSASPLHHIQILLFLSSPLFATSSKSCADESCFTCWTFWHCS